MNGFDRFCLYWLFAWNFTDVIVQVLKIFVAK